MWGIFLAFPNFAQAAAANWQANPSGCPATDPANFPGQNCTPDRICGDNSSAAQCFNTPSLSAPAGSNTTTSTSQYRSGGGYVINCNTTIDGGAPFCDNNGSFWCNPDTSCYGGGNNRETTCAGTKWSSDGGAFSCGNCLPANLDCAGDTKCEVQKNVTDYPSGANNHYGNTCLITDVRCDASQYDCDVSGVAAGNGCEQQSGVSCSLGGLSGTMQCSGNPAGSCTDGGSNYDCVCIVPKSNFQTGTLSSYATVDPLLWGRQYGAGDLISFGNASATDVFSVANDGVVKIAQASIPGVTANKLYNVGGSLYWDGTLIGTASGGVTWPLLAPDGSVAAPSYSFTNSTGMGMYRAGANILSLVTAGTDRLTIDASGNVGIGTTTPTAMLDLGLAGTTAGVMRFEGATSGYTEIKTASTTTPWTLTLPASAGTTGEVLTTNGSGGLYWGAGGSGPTLATQIFLTVATTNGNFSSGGKVGYQAATDMCNAEYPGSHFCFTGEILLIIATQDISGFSGNAWNAEGPPGYTSNSNDCNGYTSSDNTKLGAFWAYDPIGGGMGWLTACNGVKPVSCCQ